MNAAWALMGVLCILEASSFVSACNRSFSEQALDLVTRAPPPPIDCLLSQWSEWGPCDPCSKERYRSRRILKYGQFGGKSCFEPLGDKQSCVTSQVCPVEDIDCGEDFQCANGVCIQERLVCNTDNDCGDSSDEASCNDTKFRPPCRGRIVGISKIGRQAGHGLNVLGMRPKGTPFYNEFYNGFCNRERDVNTGIYYRTPWNVAVVHYRTKDDKRFSYGEFKNEVDAMKKMFTEGKLNFQSTLSLKFVPTETQINTSIELSPGLSSTNTNISRFLEEFSQRELTFLYLKATVEVGTYIMRNRGIRLSGTFLEDLKYLPSNYEMGEYFRFLETHGTHYAEKGKVGGIYELLYVLDNWNMRKQGVTKEDIKACLGFDQMVRSAKEGFGLQYEPTNCKKEQIFKANNSSERAIIHTVIPRIQGGTSAILAQLEEKLSGGTKLVSVKDFIWWAATLAKAPALIEYKPSPISALVPMMIPNAHTKKQNLDQAVEDYVAEYNVCKCQLCQNGGTVILVNGECICACSPFFKGSACQIPKFDHIIGQRWADGSWSCWSAWSPCVQGERTRTRECNNPAPRGVGRQCAGAVLERRRCPMVIGQEQVPDRIAGTA